MPDDKLKCDKFVTLADWMQLNDDPRFIEFVLCFGFGIVMIGAIAVFLYFLW